MKLTRSFNTKTKYYIKQYNENNFRIYKNKFQLEKGWEILENVKHIINGKITSDEELQRISLSRSKSKIRELALSNNFEYFGTLTIDGYFLDRYELSDCQNKLKKILKKIKRNNNDFKYLIITEKHLDNAFHFHGLFSGIELELNDFGYYYSPIFAKELGYNSFSLIKDYTKVSNYITKYITKDCVKNTFGSVFIRSKNLHFASKEEIKPIELDWKFDSDFCSIYDIDLQKLNDYEKKIILELL